MKKQIEISIPEPCDQKWEDFGQVSAGRHCPSCDKVVVDFTSMSDAELVNFLSLQPSNTCGRFRENQLKTYRVNSKAPLPLRWISSGLIGMSLMFINHEARPAEIVTSNSIEESNVNRQYEEKDLEAPDEGHDVEGIVKDEEGLLIPGAIVTLKGSTAATTTNLDGYFKFPEKLNEGDVLIISYIGYETMEYRIGKNSPIAIVLNLEMAYSLMGEVVVGGVYTKPNLFKSIWQKVTSIF